MKNGSARWLRQAFLLALSLFGQCYATTTGLWIQGSPASFVGLGQSFLVSRNDGFRISAEIQFNNVLVFRTYGIDSIYGQGAPHPSTRPGTYTPPQNYWWEIAAGVGYGALPEVGAYVDPSIPPNFADPFLSVTGNFRATNQTSGRFEILELLFSGDSVQALAIDFISFEENDPAKSIIGSIRYNSTLALTVPEPAVWLQMLLGSVPLAFLIRKRTSGRTEA